MNKWVSIGISAVSDFFITAGTAYLSVATASATAIPSISEVIICIVGGVVQAFRGVQKTLSPPPA